jgi:uncharacterized membrane protein YfcA
VFTLFAAGILAGISNAIAGGGSFFTFPVFLSLGIPPVVANASNAIAVWPGHALAVVGYRRELREYSKGIAGSVTVAIAGGAVGALLLAYVGNEAFARLIPFLILFATLLFAYGRIIGAWLETSKSAPPLTNPHPLTRLFEFAFAVYGGFFGAGLGIMLMAGLIMLGVNDIQANNALKNLLAAVINSVAIVVFAVSGLVSWPHTAIAFLGAVIGGLAGARVARALPAAWLRRVVIAVGLALSVHYLLKAYSS